MPSTTRSLETQVRLDPAIKIKPHMSSVACPECAGYHTSRVHRRTFFQRVVLFHLGYYPWRCIDCSNRFFSKERGHH
jgi:DNA-directed RNA polymerase subunit RPC12/RpoP